LGYKRNCSDALHIKDARTTQARRKWPCAQARGTTTSALGATLPPSLKGQGSVAPTRLRKDGTLGEGKPVPFIVRENRPRTTSARALTHHSHTPARPGLSARRLAHARRGKQWRSQAFCCFPEKFLERRSQSDAGRWGAQGSKRLKKAKHPKHAATPSAFEPRPRAQGHWYPQAREKTQGLLQALLPRPVLSLRDPSARGEAGGGHEKPRAHTGRLLGGRKAETRPLESPARAGPLEWAQYVGTQRGCRSMVEGVFHRVFLSFPSSRGLWSLPRPSSLWWPDANAASVGRP
ncbi:uncharacterized protein LOC116566340, partial [Sapajus apella]|uniref:Uncharacterized protein LOC116566340 n=1 Tax=Sapajus apella TaxID=9515 RepID=A0A6J3JN97_SAPAP